MGRFTVFRMNRNTAKPYSYPDEVIQMTNITLKQNMPSRFGLTHIWGRLVNAVTRPRLHERNVMLQGRPVTVQWTDKADRMLRARDSELIVEMELYFSCMVKKYVHFHEELPENPVVRVSERLSVFYQPVTSKSCKIEEAIERQPTIDLAPDILNGYVPKYLYIDYRDGQWYGEFAM